MKTEIEVKFLNIDKDEVRAKLKALGAVLVVPERKMRRKTYDFFDKKLSKKNGWVRVRDESDKITMSYKQSNGRTLHGMQEVDVIINDFDLGCSFAENIGLQQKSYQETKRESWKLGGTEIELDEWPWIPPFVEIEAASEELVKAAAQQLGFDWSRALHGSVEIVYQAVYDVTEEEIDHWPEILFTPVPGWLEKKRKK